MSSNIEELMKLCKDADLEGHGILELFSVDALSEIYNGIGPDRFPKILRDALSALHPTLLPCALIHDVQYHIGGSYEEFTLANKMFGENGKKMAYYRYAWYDPRRYLVAHKARVFADLCQFRGWDGYNKKG